MSEQQENQLAVIVQESGLEKAKAQYLLENFQDLFQFAAEKEEQAKRIVVKDESQKAEMQMARVLRLSIREKRLVVENVRKSLKEQSLREGRAIDGIANVLKALLEPLEEYLIKQERFVEIRQAEEAARKAEEERLKAERREREAIEAAEKARREEEERIRKENERLLAERKKQEEKLAAEKARRERERKAAERKLEQERKAAEAILAKEREEAAEREREREEKLRKEREEREKAEAARQIAEDQARIERELAEKKQKEAEERLAKMIECPNCHHKFVPEGEAVCELK